MPKTGARGGKYLWVNPDSVIPLCNFAGNNCHGAYDRHELSILAVLTLPEQVNSVEAAGGIFAANERLSGAG